MENGARTGEAVVFPGMGPTRFADVGKFMVINPFARELVAVANDTLGYSLVERFKRTPGDYSEYAQVAFLINCLAMARWAEREHGAQPELCVGPSFGAKTAAIYSGALDPAQGVDVAVRLARLQDEFFATEHTDVVTASFARVPDAALREILDGMAERGEWYDVACRVDADFHMVSLRREHLEAFHKELRGRGGLPLYEMHPPMHSSAFGGLRKRAEEEVFADLEFRDPRVPVVADQDGRVVTTGDGVRELLLDGFVRAVQWPEAVAAMRDRGITKVYVCGQDALFGRVGVTTRTFTVVPVNPQLVMRPERRPRRRPEARR
ncbi:[acyl-carrier-protein] S-malonyltransferase [Nocardiopsis mwathae]|uniref:[acyl-carrier-protein] S-malonyltransferase n=1 Tax=Nocardiopsis mwathae TaxID=1472723 RepID=A0A7X0D3Q6_9ACTN|nr:ACP S-malonyltransferase [Nocardiopsis mwathae]MBB6170285.1 [acyl-carrier-protein] S-malonyltransferase [Nocardiopsis mwathae]